MSLFDLQGIVPGLGGELNVRALDTPLFNTAKRIYGQVQSYFDDKMNLQNIQAIAAQRSQAAQQPGEINDFMAKIRTDGIAKPNTYAVLITPPIGNSKISPYEFKELSMLCETAEFPSINIMTSQFRTYGPFIELAYMRVNEPITLTFIADSKMGAKVIFDKWMELIINPETHNVNLYSTYVGNVTLMQKSAETTNTVYTLSLLNAYPKTVNAIPLSYAETGSYHKVSVQFVYEKVTSIQVSLKDSSAPTTSVRGQMDKIAGLDKVKSVASDAIAGLQDTLNTTVVNAENLVSDTFSSAENNISVIKSFF